MGGAGTFLRLSLDPGYTEPATPMPVFLGLTSFFQAEDGIRDTSVTGVQMCVLPISPPLRTRGGAGGYRPEAQYGASRIGLPRTRRGGRGGRRHGEVPLAIR